jgi:Na+-translocating ferredoxin:NAD+ oxidoreductase RnfD subunit
VNPLYALLSGGFLLASFFMITDPVSSSQSTNEGRWIYGIIFGTLTVLIRVFANWAEGVTFAILLANMFGPLFDHLLKTAKANRKKLAPMQPRRPRSTWTASPRTKDSIR